MLPRIRLEGAAYYITSVVANRLKIFARPSFIIPLIDSFNYYRHEHHCKIIGYVIMPDHVHLILWPQAESSPSEFMRDFKRFTSGRVARQARLELEETWLAAFSKAGEQSGRAEFKVWQDSFWEVLVMDPRILRQKLDYVHLNPVRAGLVQSAVAYPYSSSRNYENDDHSLIEIDFDWTS